MTPLADALDHLFWSFTPQQHDQRTIIRNAAQALRTLEAEKAQAEQERDALALAIRPSGGIATDWSVPQLATLASAHREDTETMDSTVSGTDDYGDDSDADKASLLRRQRATELESALAAAQQQIADLTTWRPAVRELRDAIVQVWGNEEDCEDCGDKAKAGNHEPCAVHESSRLYHAVRGVDEILGPCTCGHPSSRHEDEETTRCKDCRCDYFQLPTPPRTRRARL